MRIRRPVAVFLASVAVVGAASLTGCGAQAQTWRTGSSGDQSQLTTGNDPGGDAQGNLPNASNRQPHSSETAGGVGGGGNGGNSGG